MQRYILNIILATIFTCLQFAAILETNLVFTVAFALPALYFCIAAQRALHNHLIKVQNDKK